MRCLKFVLPCVIAIFMLVGCKENNTEVTTSVFDNYDQFMVMTSEMDNDTFEKVVDSESAISNAFNEAGTDLLDEYKMALDIFLDVNVGADKAYYGQPVGVYGLYISPDATVLEREWIVPVFLDTNNCPLLGYFHVEECDEEENSASWISILDEATGTHNTLPFDFSIVSKIFSGDASNIFIHAPGGITICNEKGWFPLSKSPEHGKTNMAYDYSVFELTHFVTDNTFQEIIDIIENESSEKLKSVDIKDEFAKPNIDSFERNIDTPANNHSIEEINSAMDALKEYLDKNFYDFILQSINYEMDLNRDKDSDTIIFKVHFESENAEELGENQSDIDTVRAQWKWEMKKKNDNWMLVNYGND